MTGFSDLAALMKPERKPVPKGWFTTRDVADDLKCSYQHAGKICSNGVRRNELERQDWPSPVGHGAPIAIYRRK